MDVASAPRPGDGPPQDILVIARETAALLERLKARERGAVDVALADTRLSWPPTKAQRRPGGAARTKVQYRDTVPRPTVHEEMFCP